MRHDFLDQYSRLDSPIHRRHAAVKLLTALTVIVAVLVTPPTQPLLLAVAAGVLLVVAAVSRIPPSFLLRRLVMLEPFVLGVAVLALFQPDGLERFAILVAKCTLCLGTMILLSNTTPFAQLLRVLKRVHVPGLLITTLSLMYRYIFVLVDETQRMKRARQSRTFTKQRRGAWRTMASVIGHLFIRTSQRAERIYGAMCSRGWK